MNVNEYLAKSYPTPPCWSLVVDVYATERGQDVDVYSTVNNSVRAIAAALKLVLRKSPHGFRQIAEPEDLCVVLMGRSEQLGLHHCGIYYEGRVLHALETGAVYQDMASLGDAYRMIEYWARPAE